MVNRQTSGSDTERRASIFDDEQKRRESVTRLTANLEGELVDSPIPHRTHLLTYQDPQSFSRHSEGAAAG
jgi:hypothetical protein